MHWLVVVVAVMVVPFGSSKKDEAVHRSLCTLMLRANETNVNKNLTEPQILYYQAEGSNSTIRYVWSLVGAPTVFVSVTNDNEDGVENCTESVEHAVNWTEFVSKQSFGSATFPGTDGDFSFAIVFNQLIEFNDTNASLAFDASNLSDDTTYRNFSLSGLHWWYNSANQTLVANSSTDSSFRWLIQVNVGTDEGRLECFPKTLFTQNSSTFDLQFFNFNYSFKTNKSRLVLDATLIHGPNTRNGSVYKNFSKDDEYTPSVFNTFNYLFGSDSNRGFLQWKPISYLAPHRKSTSSQQVNLIAGGNAGTTIPHSLASALFNDSTASNVTSVFMVFGTKADDNNMNPDYVTWTALVGYGEAPRDSVSLAIISTIAVGLGVPALFVVLGAIYVIYKKKPWENMKKLVSGSDNGYARVPVTDTE